MIQLLKDLGYAQFGRKIVPFVAFTTNAAYQIPVLCVFNSERVFSALLVSYAGYSGKTKQHSPPICTLHFPLFTAFKYSTSSCRKKAQQETFHEIERRTANKFMHVNN